MLLNPAIFQEFFLFIILKSSLQISKFHQNFHFKSRDIVQNFSQLQSQLVLLSQSIMFFKVPVYVAV